MQIWSNRLNCELPTDQGLIQWHVIRWSRTIPAHELTWPNRLDLTMDFYSTTINVMRALLIWSFAKRIPGELLSCLFLFFFIYCFYVFTYFIFFISKMYGGLIDPKDDAKIVHAALQEEGKLRIRMCTVCNRALTVNDKYWLFYATPSYNHKLLFDIRT